MLRRSWILILFIAVFTVSACNGDLKVSIEDGSDSGSSDITTGSECALGGTAAKGVINAATVTVYTVDANGANSGTVGTTTAGEDGTWKLAPDACSDDGLYRVSATGGTYTSEATQDTITNTVAYTALVDLNSTDISASAESLAITPVTTLIDSRAVSLASSKGLLAKLFFAPSSLSDSIATATTAIQDHFGLTSDPLTIQINFTDATAVESNEAGTMLGLILGAITQQAEILGLDDPGNLIVALASDFSDGVFDGSAFGTAITITDTAVTAVLSADAGTTDFTDAMDDYIENPNSTVVLNDMADDVVTIVTDIQTSIEESEASAINAGVSGSLDKTFASKGYVTTDFGTAKDHAAELAIDSDGKIVVVGRTHDATTGYHDFALARYNEDGSLDTTFGANGTGKVTTDLGGTNERIRAVAIDSSGNIVVAGHSNANGKKEFALARYTSAGVLDTTFGTNGIVTKDFGAGSFFGTMKILADGGILVGGDVTLGATIGSGGDFYLVKYTSTGVLDTTFDTDGVATIDFGGLEYGVDIDIDSQGRIVMIGMTDLYGYEHGYDMAVTRVNSDGSVDITFGTAGKVILDFATYPEIEGNIAIDANDKIIIAGETVADADYGIVHDLVIARLNTDGTLDTTFDGDGKASTHFGEGNVHLREIVLDTSGRLVFAGALGDGTARDFLVGRYGITAEKETVADRGVTFSTADFAGTWFAHQIRTGTTSDKRWAYSEQTIDTNGDGAFDYQYGTNNPDTRAKEGEKISYTINSLGELFEHTSIAFGFMNTDKNLMVRTVSTGGNWDGLYPGNRSPFKFRILMKGGTTFNPATDLAIEGAMYHFGMVTDEAGTSETAFGQFGNLSIASDGSSVLSNRSDSTLGDNLPDLTHVAGSWIMDEDGVVTHTNSALRVHWKRSADNTIMAGVSQLLAGHTAGTYTQTVHSFLVTRAESYSQADLEGTWYITDVRAGTNAGWRKKVFTIDSAGEFSGTKLFENGNIEEKLPGSGDTFTIASDGTVTKSNDPYFHGTMSADKKLIIGGTGIDGGVSGWIFMK